MKNKRADIPVTLLVIGVFAVCSLALLSFVSSTIKVSKSDAIYVLEEVSSIKEQVLFYDKNPEFNVNPKSISGQVTLSEEGYTINIGNPNIKVKHTFKP